MASTTGIPSFAGILQPHLKFKWQIHFFDHCNNHLEFTIPITKQAIRISKIRQGMVSEHTGLLPAGTLTLEFEEDILNTAMKAVQKLSETQGFTIKIEMLDGGDTVIKTTTLNNAFISEIVHSELDYAASRFDSITHHNISLPNGYELKDDNPVAELLSVLIGSKIESVRVSKNSVAVSSSVVFHFSSKIIVE